MVQWQHLFTDVMDSNIYIIVVAVIIIMVKYMGKILKGKTVTLV